MDFSEYSNELGRLNEIYQMDEINSNSVPITQLDYTQSTPRTIITPSQVHSTTSIPIIDKDKDKQKTDKLKWFVDLSPIGRDCASRQFNGIVNILGFPDWIDMERGGFAYWKKDTLHKRKTQFKIYEKIEILDDGAISKYPFEHYASVCGYFKIPIPIEKISKVLSISQNISYDIIIETIKIRGRNLYDIVALTTLICMLLKGNTTLDKIKDYKLVYKYMATLQQGSKYYEENGLKSFLYTIWKTCAST